MKIVNLDPAAVTPQDWLVRQAQKTIDVHRMMLPGQSVLIGVSGGADSVALLFALHALGRQHGWRLGVAHVNHGLRPGQADLDADYTKALARRLNLPYYLENADVRGRGRREKISLEEAGRKERYAFFAAIAESDEYDRIAVGHQKNDSAEQVLLNLLRGSGPNGLEGILPVRSSIIRPLIGISKKEIESFLKTKQIHWRTDDSNRDNRYTRNRIRNQLLPDLHTYNMQIIEGLHRLGKIMQAENEWIEKMAAPVFEQAVLQRSPTAVALCSRTLAEQPEALFRRIVRLAVREVKGDLRRITWQHVEQIRSLAAVKTRAGRQIHLPGRIRVMDDGLRIVMTREKKSLRSDALSGKQYETAGFAYCIKRRRLGGGKTRFRIPELQAIICLQRRRSGQKPGGDKKNRAAVRLDLDKVTFPLTIRNARPGDRFVPLGMNGSMKLKDFFINQKIPRSERGRIPIVHSADGIVSVGGLRIAEGVKISENTTNILEIKISENPVNL